MDEDYEKPDLAEAGEFRVRYAVDKDHDAIRVVLAQGIGRSGAGGLAIGRRMDEQAQAGLPGSGFDATQHGRKKVTADLG